MLVAMLKLLCLSFFAGMMLFGAETGKTRLLTPRSDSPTAMRRCGADLESVKADHSLVRQYVFTGEETLSGMQYCVEGRLPLVDDRHMYRVPAGTIGWLSEDGQQVVLDQCVNMAQCTGCPPVEPPPPPPPPTPEPTPEPAPPAEEVVLPPAQPPVELNELPPPPDWPETGQYQVTLTWDKKGRPLWTKLPVIHCVYAYTVGIRDWSKWGTAEKIGFCPAEAFLAWWLWPVSGPAATVGHKIVPVLGVITP